MPLTYMDLHRHGRLYIPSRLGDVEQLIAPMIGDAPTMIDKAGHFPFQSIESCFFQLTQGLINVRERLGEESYAAATSLAARAKDLFTADADAITERTRDGIDLLLEIKDLVDAARKYRFENDLPDEDGQVTGD